ncbi:MAG: hypothetical protein K0U29_03785 [Gammaproteobacteria bacterium]|nr:hypothetical protein [Gammaproteobacteria bacterium]MCH9744034.1 hypothetical protein [Gammaproteobacteria bacterium]
MRVGRTRSFATLVDAIKAGDKLAVKIFSYDGEDNKIFFGMLNDPVNVRPIPPGVFPEVVGKHYEKLACGAPWVGPATKNRVYEFTYYKAEQCSNPEDERFNIKKSVITEFDEHWKPVGHWRRLPNGTFKRRGVPKPGATRTKSFSMSPLSPQGGKIFAKGIKSVGLLLDLSCLDKEPLIFSRGVAHLFRFDTTWSEKPDQAPLYHQDRIRLDQIKDQEEGSFVEMVGRADCRKKLEFVRAVYVQQDCLISRMMGLCQQQKVYKELGEIGVPIVVRISDSSSMPEEERPDIVYRDYTPQEQWHDIITTLYYTLFGLAGQDGVTRGVLQASLDELDFDLFDAELFVVDAVMARVTSPESNICKLTTVVQRRKLLSELYGKSCDCKALALTDKITDAFNRFLRLHAKELISGELLIMMITLHAQITGKAKEYEPETTEALIQELIKQGYVNYRYPAESYPILYHACSNGKLHLVKMIAEAVPDSAKLLATNAPDYPEWFPIYAAACVPHWDIIDYILATFLESKTVLTQEQLKSIDECIAWSESDASSLKDAPAEYKSIHEFIRQNKAFYHLAVVASSAKAGGAGLFDGGSAKREAAEPAEKPDTGKRRRTPRTSF